MVDLKQSEIYTRSKYIIKALDEAFIWQSIFNQREMQQRILFLLREDQLMDQGIDGEGDIIGIYTSFTESLNYKKKAGTPYTLYDTGAFYVSMYISVVKNAILINADSQKMEDKNWWRNEILELTDENLAKIRVDYTEKVQNYVRDVLLGHR